MRLLSYALFPFSILFFPFPIINTKTNNPLGLGPNCLGSGRDRLISHDALVSHGLDTIRLTPSRSSFCLLHSLL